MKLLLLIILSFLNGIGGWGIPDWAENAWDATVEGTTSTWNSMSTAVSEAAGETTEFFEELADNPIVKEVVTSIHNVVTLTVDKIEDVVSDFNVTTWKRMAKDAKYVIYSLPSQVQGYLAEGCNYLGDLVEDDMIPHPLDSIHDDDLHAFADCITGPVFDLAKEWTQEVATTFTSIVGDREDTASVDFSPLLNTEPVQEELNETYACLHEVGNAIQRRAEEAKDTLWDKATDYFALDNLTVTIEISFTACTLTCGTASLGFAVNTANINQRRAFYTVSLGVDSSKVIGASIGARLGFRPKFNIEGTHHGVKFGIGLKLPLLPSLPDITLAISADERDKGQFRGFILKSDIIDLSLGVPSVFSLGYAYTTTKWVYTTNDLRDAWHAVEDIVQDRKETIDKVVNAYEYLTNNVLDHGGYLVKAAHEAETVLRCPSGVDENNEVNAHIGNLSVLQLGLIDVYHVVFGNVEGDNDCNSTTGYDAVREQCQWGSKCSIKANAETLGNLYCAAKDVSLTVIYGCPDQLDVFNLGCYAVSFKDVIDKEWYQDQTDTTLDDGWEKRKNGLAKCARIAKDKGYEGFATYNNGMCLMAKDMFKDGVYNAFGVANESTGCPLNGLGNDVTMNLYAFAKGDIAYDDLGCVNTTQIEMYNKKHRADIEKSFKDFEGEHYLFQDEYKERRNAISKCAQMADERGYKGFALFDGGKCYLSNYFRSDVVDKIHVLSNVSNETTLSCGRGMDDAYQMFEFPGVVIEDEKKTLTTLQIILIVTIPLAVIALCVIGYFVFKNCECKKPKRGAKSGGGDGDYYAMHARITNK
eukprot:306935_1